MRIICTALNPTMAKITAAKRVIRNKTPASEPNGDGNSAKNQKSDESAANENSNPPELKNNSGKVNINTATKEELTTLDGIGEKYAERIIETRERRGGFTSIEQITEVKGIGQKRFEKIKDEITVGEPGENK